MTLNFPSRTTYFLQTFLQAESVLILHNVPGFYLNRKLTINLLYYKTKLLFLIILFSPVLEWEENIYLNIVWKNNRTP